MKFYFSIVLISLSSIWQSVVAQSPVSWSFTTEQITSDEYQINFIAKIDEGWYTYSQVETEDGPLPTSFEFYNSDQYNLIGDIEESGNRKKAKEPAFGNIEVIKFSEKAIFSQKVKFNGAPQPITGYLSYMTCDGERCLPPVDVDFKFDFDQNDQLSKTTKVESEEAPKTASSSSIVINESSEENPVAWTFYKNKISDVEYELVVHADIADSYSLYSAYLGPDVSPEPTTFEFFESDFYKLGGKLTESDNVKTKFDKVFEEKISKFSGYATFKQRVILNKPDGKIEGYMTGMFCDDHACRQFNEDLSFLFGSEETAAATAGNVGGEGVEALRNENTEGVFDSKRNIDHDSYLSDCGVIEEKSDSIWMIFVLGFLGGLVALLTPCVFPMIPLTVSFFTGRGTDKAGGIRKAIIYGLSIIVIYVVIGTLLTSLFGPTILNRMSVDPFFNVFFFLILVVFAFSFFGFYELTLPSSWVNSADKAADKGGLIGIFFMAGTLALVSFSCTGPIIGTLLVNAVNDTTDASMLFGYVPIRPVTGMFGFALALALPFTLFAMFPSWLNSLPKSGSWMNNVKVTLGFLELAFAFKFLSIADMVRHWGILKYELFMAIWILLFLLLALYQFGIFKFKHDSPIKGLGIGRIIVGSLSLLFSAWMGIALFNYDPMPVASGLAPPAHYNYFRPMDCPYGLDCLKDFDEAVAKAKAENKPLFVDFTGYGCVNCRDVEENVWVDPQIQDKLRNDFVVVSLYVDDQKRLFPDDKRKHLLDKYTNSRLRTVGSKWASFEVNNFEISSQPYYVLMDHEGKQLLNKPIAYTRDIDAYRSFLDCGLTTFSELSE